MGSENGEGRTSYRVAFTIDVSPDEDTHQAAAELALWEMRLGLDVGLQAAVANLRSRELKAFRIGAGGATEVPVGRPT